MVWNNKNNLLIVLANDVHIAFNGSSASAICCQNNCKCFFFFWSLNQILNDVQQRIFIRNYPF